MERTTSSALRNLSYEIVMGNLSEVTGNDQDKLNLLKPKAKERRGSRKLTNGVRNQ